jgi:glycosyltransferase involved in cell wall biosynthesis
MKVLLVSISAPPQNAPESLQVMRYARHLAEHTELTVLTIKEEKSGWRRADPGLEKVNCSARFVRLPHYSLFSRLVVKIFGEHVLLPDADFLFPLQWRRAVGKLGAKPDVIYSRSTPYSSALMGLKLHEYYRVPWIMHLSDPWADNPFLNNLPQKLKDKHQRLEKLCMERAWAITLTSSQAIQYYQAKYPSMKNKFRLLFNVFDECDICHEPIDFSAKCRFVFTGRLYGKRRLHPLIEALEAAIAQNPKLEEATEFLFAGFFADENIHRIRTASCRNIQYIGPVSLSQALELQRKSTVLISIDALEENNTLYNLFFPSKLLDYLASGRKILCITGKDSPTFEIVNNRFGWCFHSENLSQLPGFLNEIQRRYDQQDRTFFQYRGDFSQFSAQYNVNNLLMLLKEAVQDAR